MSDAGVSDALISGICPDSKPSPALAKEAEPARAAWKAPPTALSRVKTDFVSFIEKPTLVYVAVRPTDYFNYGYSDARETHFGFELAELGPDDDVRPVGIYGYADRRWAGPFFDQISRDLESAGGKYEWVPATLVAMYKRSRSKSSSDHLEILAASMGEDRSVTPETRGLGVADGGASAGSAARDDNQDARSPERLSVICTPFKVLFNGEDPLADQPEAREREAGKLPKVRFSVEGAKLKSVTGDNAADFYDVTENSDQRLVATKIFSGRSVTERSKIEIRKSDLRAVKSFAHVNAAGTVSVSGSDISGKQETTFFYRCRR